MQKLAKKGVPGEEEVVVWGFHCSVMAFEAKMALTTSKAQKVLMPAVTPDRGVCDGVLVCGLGQGKVNYDELGPGYYLGNGADSQMILEEVWQESSQDEKYLASGPVQVSSVQSIVVQVN